MNRPLLYKTQTRDASTKLPVVVIDSTALPDENRLPDPAAEVPAYLEELPESSFVIAFLASRAPRAPNLAWIRKVHAMLDRQLKKRIIKIYVVHARWYTRALNRAIGPVVSPKFSRKVQHVKDLAELSRYMDITTIDFSPRVYLDDMARSDSSDNGEILIPKHCDSIFEQPLTHTPNAYWRAALIYLHQVPIGSKTFLPVSKSNDEEADLVHVLVNAVKREQRLRLADYGPHAVLATLKEYMASLPRPLISLRQVPLPLTDTEEYLSKIIADLQAPAFMHLDQLMSWIKSLDPEHVSRIEVARSMGPAILGLYNPSKEQHAISVRLVRTLIEFWPLEAGERRKVMVPREASNEIDVVRKLPAKPPVLPPRSRVVSESVAVEVYEDEGLMPRYLPSEVTKTRKSSVPNRRAFGRVAEIMKKFDESYYI